MVGSSRGGWAVLWYVADAITGDWLWHFEVDCCILILHGGRGEGVIFEELVAAGSWSWSWSWENWRSVYISWCLVHKKITTSNSSIKKLCHSNFVHISHFPG